MRNNRKLLPMLSCAAFLGGCAFNQQVSTSDTTPLTVKPNISVAGASGSAASMYQLGRYYQGQNRYDQAIDAYKKSLAADSSFAEAHNGLGVVYSKTGRYDEAVAEFMDALQQSPQAAHIHNNLGYTHYLQGHYDESIQALKQALVLDPNNERALKNLNLAYEKAGVSDQAVQTVPDAADMGPASVKARIEADEAKTQDSWELKAADNKIAGRESSGLIIRASDARMEVVQIAPAVYQLQRHETAKSLKLDTQLSQKTGIEVSNGNGVLGMAKKVGVYLRQSGYPASRYTNQKPFTVMKTQVQYRAGYQIAAKELQAKIPGQPRLVQRNDLREGINLKLVLGKDLVDDQAFFVGK